MPDMVSWLRSLGLERYAESFAANDVDLSVLPDLSEADLERLGVTLGHRKKLLKAIEALRQGDGVGGPVSPTSGEPSSTPAPRTASAPAERRQLTVMFVDLVGSTELARALDPEEMRELLGAYQDALGVEVARYGGNVAKMMGDGVLVYFGYPQAHEDDAVRAIYAGLAVVRAVKRLGKRMLEAQGGRLRARVGIATGLVVVGDLVGAEGSEAGAVTGETPNLAFRLQEAAGSGRVAVAERTRALAGDAFTYEEVEERQLKGFPDRVKLWRVMGPSGAESRFEALHGRWLTPLVGREHELALLMERWGQTKEGDGQVVLIAGEPGIGKSRITEVLRERVMADDHVRIRLQCSPYHANSALHPVIEHLERASGFEREDDATTRLDKLEAMIALSGVANAETAPLLAALLSIPTGDRYPALAMSPERQKERTLATLTDLTARLTTAKPLLLILEDAHWIDPTTLESIDLSIGRAEAMRILIVVTYRPEFHAKWVGRPNVTLIAMNRLSKRQGATMVEGVAGGRTLPPEIMDQVVAKTDGVPLFVEELTRMVLESGLLREENGRYVLDGPLPPLAIPATLHDSLMARLDRLAPAKEVAQTAAAIGRTFSYELLAAVVPMEAPKLAAALDQLVEAGLVFRQGQGAEASYTFKHALVQDAAYASLLKSQRQRLHARIADVLEKQFPAQADAAPEVIAQHFAQAGLTEQAITWWAKAGRRAFDRSANVEAIASLTKALALYDERSDRAALRDTELDILIALGSALTAVQGYSSTETQRITMRARAACRGLQDVNRVIPILFGAWSTHIGLGEYDKSNEVALEMLQFVENNSYNNLSHIFYLMHGYENMMWGKFDRSYECLKLADDNYVTGNSDDVAFQMTEHPGALIHVLWLQTKFCLGRYDSAHASMKKSIDETQRSRHVNSIGYAKWVSSIHLFERGDYDEALFACDDAIRYAEDHSIATWRAGGLILKGLARVSLGAKTDGVALVRQGLSEWRATGTMFQTAQMFSYVAQTLLIEGRIDEAGDALEEGLSVASQTGEVWYNAELFRMRGENFRARGSQHEALAEADFQRAHDVALGQGARAFELRAAMSLARLWAERGERARARDLLAPIYGWFTEGFDTRDLKKAKSLLDQLA